MSESEIEGIQACFMQFVRRAEKVSDEILAKTFVDAAPLLVQLSARNNQVLYGRRGTGKTQALKYLADQKREGGGYPIYIDLRTVGSNGSIYGDQDRPLSERATQLILDVLEAIESELWQIAISRIEDAPDKNQITLRIDDFSKAIRQVSVRDPVSEREISGSSSSEKERKGSVSLTAEPDKGSLNLSGQISSHSGINSSQRVKETGQLKPHIDFGSLQTALNGLINILGIDVLLLIDEWSEIPSDLQPYLADLFRRTILPQDSIIVKIAAIEHRSTFAQVIDAKSFIGLELGAGCNRGY
jgi:hypothetical protein